ncbi:MAG: CHRD domain-containing protein [Candidatus Krumholzibacteriia bacterium]
MIRLAMLLTLLTVLAVGAGSVQAAVIYEAELTPESVQPASGATAYGQATLILNDDRTEVLLTLNFAGLDTPQTAASLLFATADEVGTVARALPVGTPLAEVFNYTAAIGEALLNDGLAIQVYSEDWPDGAIRGNFQFVTVGTTTSTWSQLKTLFD